MQLVHEVGSVEIAVFVDVTYNINETAEPEPAADECNYKGVREHIECRTMVDHSLTDGHNNDPRLFPIKTNSPGHPIDENCRSASL